MESKSRLVQRKKGAIQPHFLWKKSKKYLTSKIFVYIKVIFTHKHNIKNDFCSPLRKTLLGKPTNLTQIQDHAFCEHFLFYPSYWTSSCHMVGLVFSVFIIHYCQLHFCFKLNPINNEIFIFFQFIINKLKENNGDTVLVSNVPERPTATRYIRLFPKQPAKPEDNDNSRVCVRLKVLGCDNGIFFIFIISYIEKGSFLCSTIAYDIVICIMLYV